MLPAAVWARENTREAIFDVLQRREVYASTAMGGELPERAELKDAKAPAFRIGAMKDPQGANLDRIQVVKDWLGDDSESLHEKVYDGDRPGGRTPERTYSSPMWYTPRCKESCHRGAGS